MLWKPKGQQQANPFRLFNESMYEIMDNLDSLATSDLRDVPRTARRLAVELRKLLCDGTPLVHQVLEGTRFHPLHQTESLLGDKYTNNQTIQLALANERREIMGPAASHTWSICVYPLHGLRFDSPSKKWIFQPMFDKSGTPLRLEPWLKQRLFCVDDREYSLRDTLSFLANKEAAHVDTKRDTLHEDMERVPLRKHLLLPLCCSPFSNIHSGTILHQSGRKLRGVGQFPRYEKLPRD